MIRKAWVLLLLVPIGLLASLVLNRAAPAGDVGGAASVYRVRVQGVIELGLAPYIARSIQEAEATGAKAIVLDIETPGGRVDAAQQIVRALQDTPVPTYAFVNIHAFSAGALIALATDGIYMRPGAVIGAATPVTGDGQKAPEKIVSAMRSEMRALAQARNLDPLVAEGMVDEDIEIPNLKPKGKLLTLTEQEAVRVGYAEQVTDWDALVERLGLEEATVVQPRVNWAENLVRFFTHPAVAPLLLSLGFLGLIVEIKAPGFGLAGAAGLACLGLFFGSHYLVGLAGMEEIILLGIGLILVLVEAFVIPGFGIAGIGGTLAIMASIYLSLVSSVSTQADFGVAAGILSTAILVVIVAGWAIIRSLPRSGRFTKSGIMLAEDTSNERGYISAATRAELVGTTGIAMTDLRPSGTAAFGDERLDVVTDGEWVSAGTPVKVIRSEGYKHVVRATS